MVWKLTRAVRREVVGKAGKAARWLPTLPVKDNRQFFFGGKADVLILMEGSNPGCARASV
jgi:hypothetical protein